MMIVLMHFQWVLVPDKSVDNAFTDNLATEYDFGKEYWMDKCDIKSTAKACFSRSGWLRSSGAKSKHICIEGTPATIIGKSCRGYPWMFINRLH